MAGTLILLGRAGYEMHYMSIADGACGSQQTGPAETATIRLKEAAAAAKLIGAHFHPPLVHDMELLYELPLVRRIAALMRDIAPEILLTHPPADYMEDHTNACRLAVTAAFTHEMPNFATDPPRPIVDQPVTVYHSQPNGNRDPLGAARPAQSVCRHYLGHRAEDGDARIAQEPRPLAGHDARPQLLRRVDAGDEPRGGRDVRPLRVC